MDYSRKTAQAKNLNDMDAKKIEEIVKEFAYMSLGTDWLISELIAKSKEEAEERFEKARKILRDHNITFSTWDVENECTITHIDILCIASGKEES